MFNYLTTVLVLRMKHRKWKESKQQPSLLPGPVSFHFLWAIPSTSIVYYNQTLKSQKQNTLQHYVRIEKYRKVQMQTLPKHLLEDHFGDHTVEKIHVFEIHVHLALTCFTQKRSNIFL